MTKEEFQKLLEKYENGQCTPSEEKLLDQFLASFQQPLDTSTWSKQEEEVTGKRIFESINRKIASTETSTSNTNWNWVWWILSVLIIGLGIYWAFQKFYGGKKQVKEDPIIYANLETKSNERKEVRLNDGTIITLNENSTLKYPTTFLPAQERRLQLSGEAFFQVAKDSSRAFIVLSGNIETVVLGTSFNITARPESEKIQVTLVKGKVQVTTSNKEKLDILQANELLVYNKKDNTTQKSTFKGNLPYAWKEDVVYFEDAPVGDVVKVLSEKYNAVFQIQNEEGMKSLLVYPVNTRKYHLTQVMEHISKVTDYHFIQNADGSIRVEPK